MNHLIPSSELRKVVNAGMKAVLKLEERSCGKAEYKKCRRSTKEWESILETCFLLNCRSIESPIMHRTTWPHHIFSNRCSATT